MKKFKARCSGISQVMSEPKTLTASQKIAKLESQVKKAESAYDKLKTKDGAMGLKYVANVSKWSAEIKEMESIKDEIILSDTCLSHLRKWYNFNYLNRSKNIETNVIKKGIWGEEESTTLLNKLYAKEYGYQILKTSKDRGDDQRRTNEFITGECDVYIPSHKVIRDLKTSWDIHTFPGGAFPKRTLDKGYHDQQQGYLELWDCDTAFVDYCLINTPTRLVSDHLSRLNWKHSFASIDTNDDYQHSIPDDFVPLIVEMVSNMIYTEYGLRTLIADPMMKFDLKVEWFKDFIEIPEDQRHVCYEVKRDKIFMEQVNEKVIKIREYIKQNSLITKIAA